jgi:putative oxidoreductase
MGAEMTRAIDTVLARAGRVRAALERAEWLPPLLVRLFVGYFFFETGLGKVRNLGTFAERFQEWGIPSPAVSAAVSGYTELIGGALIALGLFTRLASIPLIVNMAVATLTVKLKKVAGLDDFVELDEPLYALSFLWLLVSGPGPVSLDALATRLLRRRAAKSAALGEAKVSRAPSRPSFPS